MADSDNSGLGKLLVGGAAAWLLWQYAQQRGLLGPVGCPPNAVQVRLSDGTVQCVPASQLGGVGGLSVGQTIQLVSGIVATVVSIGAQVAAAIAKAASASGTAAGTGASTAATTTATVTTTTATAATDTASTATDVGADVASEAITLGLDASFTTALGYMAILYAAAELTTLMAQWIGGIANNRARADRKAPTNFDDVLYNEQAAFADFVAKLTTSLNTKIQAVAAKTGQTPVYPDLNKQVALPTQAVSGFRGFGALGGSRARNGRGGRRFGAVVARSIPRATTAAPTKAALPTTVQQNIANLLATMAATASKTPYSSDTAIYAGGHNSLGTVGAWCAGAGTYCYYLTTLDPRLPVGTLQDYRALMRWMFWTQERLYNSTMRQYWQSRMSVEGAITECRPGEPAATCLNRLTVPEAQFDTALTAYYKAVPATELLPAAYQTFVTYAELNAVALEYLQNLNRIAASAGGPQISFDALTKSVQFNGIAQAVCQAAQIGFGTWASGYPMHFVDGVLTADNETFCNSVKNACGLTSWAPASSTLVVNSFGAVPVPRWLIQDPATGWFIDIVASREQAKPVCYKFQPAGAYPLAPGTPPIPMPDEYVPLSGYGEGRERQRGRRQYGRVVPLSPSRGGFMDVLARGFAL